MITFIMIKFLDQHGYKVEWTTDVERLGVQACGENKRGTVVFTSEENYAPKYTHKTIVGTNEAGKNVYKQRTTLRGGDVKPIKTCRFCREIQGTDFYMLNHFQRTHMRENGYPELLTDRDQYVCPVRGCEVSFDSHKANASRDRATASRNRASRRAMVRHLGDVQGHTIPELLDAGVQAWSYR